MAAQNVLIHQLPSLDCSGSWWVKLADFGISKSLEATYSVIAIGTYDYMAPELFHRSDNASKLDVRLADIWAVGVMTFYILTKDKGFRAWRSSFNQFVQPTEDGTRPIRLGKDRPVVDFEAVLFVLEATREHLESRLQWKNAGQHPWLGLHGSTPGLAVEKDEFVSPLLFYHSDRV
jgi:serine/threonine protein kinase